MVKIKRRLLKEAAVSFVPQGLLNSEQALHTLAEVAAGIVRCLMPCLASKMVFINIIPLVIALNGAC